MLSRVVFSPASQRGTPASPPKPQLVSQHSPRSSALTSLGFDISDGEELQVVGSETKSVQCKVELSSGKLSTKVDEPELTQNTPMVSDPCTVVADYNPSPSWMS